ncbi:5'/3'-nucleotidase SurE [Treponema parvum]|uniref:5'-nucleotidase SurE n=1 Tax=Treponema parvum TaxID=138851 RepID=A0A975ICF6_9SPIR|nr:5'/3'-nucleotidase SurE [Treponema parvum]QTQ11668.1 5'/3'-nucleotidase SurE [Treponema parvum]
MLLLLTNDDGISGDGLSVLAKRLSFEHEVWVVAPDRNRSGVSQCVSMDRSLKLTKIKDRVYCYEGTPADCVILSAGSGGRLLSRVPDAVISGINQGANIGTDIVYSGTAAAARQAALAGIPGIALSLETHDENYYYEGLADFAAKNLELLISLCRPVSYAEEHDGNSVFVNVNALSSSAAYLGVKMTDISFRRYNDSIKIDEIDDETKICSAQGGKIHTSGRTYHDYEAVEKGFISVTRVYAEPKSAGIVDDISFSL